MNQPVSDILVCELVLKHCFQNKMKLSFFERPTVSTYKGIELLNLGIDRYLLDFNTSQDFYLYASHKECTQCYFTPSEWIKKTVIVLNTNYDYVWSSEDVQYLNGSDPSIFSKLSHEDVGQFGVYTLNGDEIKEIIEPVSIYFPLLTVSLLYVLIYSLIFLLIWIYDKYNRKNEDKPGKKERIRSLDTFRGIAIAMMIFANFGSGGYASIEHTAWNGLHFADVIFPWFLWIMGVCIPISLKSSFKKNSNRVIMKGVLKRSCKLFLVGLFLGGGSDLRTIRIMGVLQRFGICYLVVTAILVFSLDRNAKEGVLEDLRQSWRSWLVGLSILTVYLLLIFLVHEENCPKGYLGPGGKDHFGQYYDCVGGATGYIDRAILQNHLYKYPTSSEPFESSQAFDPEGLVGCLPSIIHVLLGAQAGIILLAYKSHKDRLSRWMIWALCLGLIGGGLCGFSKNDGVIPLNKNLWSLSFVAVTTSFAYILLSLLYVLIDLLKVWSGKPFLFAGMNAILMYIGHSLTGGLFPVSVEYSIPGLDNYSSHFSSTMSCVWAASSWVLASYYLYRIDYFFVL